MIEQRLRKAKLMKPLIANGRHRVILFFDEKLLPTEEVLNPQNVRVFLKNRSAGNIGRRIIERQRAPTSVMVWGGICATGKTPLVFIQRGAEIDREVYIETVLKKAFVPWTQEHFGKSEWIFEQDGTPLAQSQAH